MWYHHIGSISSCHSGLWTPTLIHKKVVVVELPYLLVLYLFFFSPKVSALSTDSDQYRHISTMQDNSVALADSFAEQYASVMDGLIADCNHLEDRVAELENRLQRAVQERDAAAAERDATQHERDQAVQDLENIEGTFGDEDLREYCEVCNLSLIHI